MDQPVPSVHGDAPALPAAKGDPALLVGRTGRWRWPWAVVGLALLFVIVLTLFRALVRIEAWIAARYAEPLDPSVHLAAGRLDTFASFVTFSAAMIIGAVVVLRIVHGVGWRAGLGPLQRFDWSLFWKAAAAYTIMNIATTAFDVWRYPDSFRLVEHTWRHAGWLALGVLVILPQAFGEDYLFKGYLLRAWGAIVPYRLVVIPLCAAFFTALHAGNTDVGSDLKFNLIGFIVVELVAFALVVRTGSIAPATGIHWINNVAVMALVATVPGQPANFALVEYTHPLLAAGLSKASDPLELIGLGLSVVLLCVMFWWPRSPLYMPAASPGELSARLPPAPPAPVQTAAGSSAAASS